MRYIHNIALYSATKGILSNSSYVNLVGELIGDYLTLRITTLIFLCSLPTGYGFIVNGIRPKLSQLMAV